MHFSIGFAIGRKKEAQKMEKHALNGRIASGLAAAFEDHAVAAPAVTTTPTIMSLFEAQHPAKEAVQDIMAELARLADIDMEAAAADYVSTDAMPPLPPQQYMSPDGMQILSDQAEQMRVNEGHKVLVKKRSFKQSIGEVFDDEQSAGVVDAGAKGKTPRVEGDGITTAQIKQFYEALLACDTANRYHFTECTKKYAHKIDVSVTSLRNILTFKNRRQDSSPFWNEALWGLYKESCRCLTCREESHADSKVLCTHFGRGRPTNKNKHKEVTATRHRKSSAEMLKKKESNNGLQRAYIVQICVTHVWAVLGCFESKQKLLDKQPNDSKDNGEN